MPTGETTQRGRSQDEIRDEVRQTVRQLSDLASSEANFDKFSNAVLEKIVSITGAFGAAMWQVNGNQGPVITHKAGESPSPLASRVLSTDNDQHVRMLMKVIQSAEPQSVDGSTFAENPSEAQPPFLLLLAPIQNRNKQCMGVMELLQRGNVSDQAKDGYLRFINQVSQLFQRWHEQQDLARLSQHADSWSERLDFINESHRSIDFKETAYSIANEARRLLKCDRVSVAKWNGSRCKVIAISSQDKFDNRANVVKKLGKIATASVSADAPFWILGNTEGIAPEVARKINDYLDEAHSRTLAILPLFAKPPETAELEMKSRRKKKPKKLGALIIEYFDQDVAEHSIEEDTKLIVGQSQLALENSRKHGEIFLLPIWKRLGWLQKVLFQDHFAKTMTGLLALALLIAAMLLWPMELEMKIDGVMQPSNRRTIFAQTEGIVETVHVGNRGVVKQGDLLLELRSPDLDLQLKDIEGQLITLDQQIRTNEYRVARGFNDPAEMQEATSTLQLYEYRKTNLIDQQRLIDQKKKRLKIYAPIDGTVVTWDAKRRLLGLPVAANQAVLAVDDLDSDWQLELKVPQNKIGYINRAIGEAKDEPLDVSFIIETNPNLRLTANLTDLASRAEPSDQGIPEFRATAKAAPENLNDLRPGAGVTARVSCGEVKLWYWCFYQVYDWVRTKVLF